MSSDKKRVQFRAPHRLIDRTDALAEPVVLDATVLSNFASSDAVGWLAETVPGLGVVPAVHEELAAERDHDHVFLDSALGDAIPVLSADDSTTAGPRHPRPARRR